MGPEAGIFLLLLFFALLATRTPIHVALGLAAIAIIVMYNLGVKSVSYTFYANIAKFPLLAIPFYILAGVVMQKAGMAERLIKLISALFGWMSGGMGIATVAVALLWGAVSGSGPATVAALGLILIPGMVASGYPKPYATALVSACSELAIVIPPSIALIIYGVITSESVPVLFMGGFMPGLLVGLFFIALTYLIGKRHGYTGVPWQGWRALGATFTEAFWGLMTPVIILGGIYSGIFTPTEAAAVAVFYGLFVGFFVYRTMNLKSLYELLVESTISTAVVMIVVTFAGLFSWAATTIGIVEIVAKWILGFSAQPWFLLILINALLLILGTMLDAISIFYITLPIFMPLIQHMGWSNVWFGLMMTVNLAIGQITPPVAVNLYVGARIARLSIESIWAEAWKFALVAIIALLIIAYVPDIVLFLPRLTGLIK